MINHPLLERVRVRSHAITDATSLFSHLSGLRQVEIETSGIEIFDQFFYYCSALAAIPPLDTSNGWKFSGMFQGCSALLTIPPLDTSKGTDFSAMFAWLTDYGGKLCSLAVFDTSKATNCASMFMGCSLRRIPELDLSSLVGSIEFCYCPSLCSIDVSGLGEALSEENQDRITVNVEQSSLDAAALNAFYRNLAPVNNNRGMIYAFGTPGSMQPEHQPELATSKGWIVYY